MYIHDVNGDMLLVDPLTINIKETFYCSATEQNMAIGCCAKIGKIGGNCYIIDGVNY